MTTKHKDFRQLYVFEGCGKHGCKIGVSHEHGLAGRLIGARQICRASSKFARTWRLPNAYQIEQCVVGMFSERKTGVGEEWFHVPVDEMIDAVGFALELYDPDKSKPRQYRLMCGHVSKVATN